MREANASQERMFERLRVWVTVRLCRYQWACVCGVDGGGGGGDGEWVQVWVSWWVGEEEWPWRCLFLFLWPYLSMWVQVGGRVVCLCLGVGLVSATKSVHVSVHLQASFSETNTHVGTAPESPVHGSCTLACKRNCDTNSVQLRRWPQAAAQHTPHWSTPNANLGCSVDKPRQRCLLATHQPLHRSSTTAFLRVAGLVDPLCPSSHTAPCISLRLPAHGILFSSLPPYFTQSTSLESSLVVTFRGLSRHTLAPDAFSPAHLTWSFQISDDSEVPRRHFMGVSDFLCVFSRWCVWWSTCKRTNNYLRSICSSPAVHVQLDCSRVRHVHFAMLPTFDFGQDHARCH